MRARRATAAAVVMAFLDRENRGDVVGHGGGIGRIACRGRIVLRELCRRRGAGGGYLLCARGTRQVRAVFQRTGIPRLRGQQSRAGGQYRDSSRYPIAVLIKSCGSHHTSPEESPAPRKLSSLKLLRVRMVRRVADLIAPRVRFARRVPLHNTRDARGTPSASCRSSLAPARVSDSPSLAWLGQTAVARSFAARDVDGARFAEAPIHPHGARRNGSRAPLDRSARAGYRPFHSDIHATACGGPSGVASRQVWWRAVR